MRALAAAAILSLAATSARAEGVLRIGYQKYGTLILLKAKGGLEERLKPLGVGVTWTEFPAGPQLLEAMNAGAIDVGSTGEAPPIFAQAAGVPLIYFGNEPPAPDGEAILVPKDSPIGSVAELKGKKVALNKGSNVHYLLVRALEKAGVAYTDIKPVFLAPADARAAFETGAVDAWAIWDPYLASAQAGTGARTLVTGVGLAPNVQYYLATRSFAGQNVAVVDALVAAIDEVDRWAGANTLAVAAQIGTAIHVPASVIATALQRQTYGVSRIDDKTVAEQQKVADAFAALHLLPKPISISDAILKKPGL